MVQWGWRFFKSGTGEEEGCWLLRPPVVAGTPGQNPGSNHSCWKYKSINYLNLWNFHVCRFFKRIWTYLLAPFIEFSIARFALRASKSSKFFKRGAPPPSTWTPLGLRPRPRSQSTGSLRSPTRAGSLRSRANLICTQSQIACTNLYSQAKQLLS